jgi:formylglycine-generating enzyme required for sulfatase activity
MTDSGKGFLMKTLVGLTVLCVATCLSLACSSGEAVSDFGSTAFKTPIPYEIRSSFVGIPGGVLTNRLTPSNETLFTSLGETNVVEAQESRTAYGVDTQVSSFSMMDSEVTVQMFADFMNILEKNFESILDDDSLTVTNQFGEVIQVGFTAFTLPSTTIYKPVMQDSFTCGIYMFDEFGQDVSGEIVTTGGFVLKPAVTEGGYVDPVAHYVGKPRGVGKGVTFEVAPGRGDYPMVFVTRSDAEQFCRWLGSAFRLPTDAEFHYAGKAGGSGDFSTSTGNIYRENTDGSQYINPVTGEPEYLANIQGEFSVNYGTEEVRSFPSNAFGLFDLTGNVYEWTSDPNVSITSEITTSTPVMGGSFASTFLSAGSTWAILTYFFEGAWSADLGFRVAYNGELETISDAEFYLYGETAN